MVAVLSPDVLTALRFTVDEYLQADLPEGRRYELVDGEIDMTPVPGLPHDRCLTALTEALYAHRSTHRSEIEHISHRAAVPIPGTTTVREPDLALYRKLDSTDSSWRAWQRSTPFWVAEIISPAQAKRDYEDKRRDYWLAGIDEYWIVDREARRVTVLVRGEKDWRETVFAHDQEARSSSLPGFAVPVSRLIGEADNT